MNERIKELAEQAWTIVSAEKRINGDLYEADQQRLLRDQVFAELIIRKCIDVLDYANITELEGWEFDPEDVLYVAGKQIRKHFGMHHGFVPDDTTD
jgi:hypothetical protein